jgi:hypothetical protein
MLPDPIPQGERGVPGMSGFLPLDLAAGQA